MTCIKARARRRRIIAAMIQRSLLLTDLYQLTMLEAYAAHGMAETAVFELFVRKLPPARGFLMAAGLEQAVRVPGSLRVHAG